MWGCKGRRKIARRETRRPRSSTFRVEVDALEGRCLQVIIFPAPNPIKPDPLVVPKVLTPSNGQFVPVTVSGTFKEYYAASFVKPYAPFPIPVYAALQVASRFHPQQGSSGTTMVQIPGSPTPLKVDYLPNPNVPNQEILAVRTVPPFEAQVVIDRLKARPIPKNAILTVTDQYRRVEPQTFSPLTVTGLTVNQNYTNFVFPAGKGSVLVSIPTGYLLERDFTYSFTTNLQQLKHAGTTGRQYAINVYAEDSDSGGQANTVALVPTNAPSGPPAH
jgi:hypothetical protein